MPRLFNKFLDKQGSVPKSCQGFRVGPLVILLKFLTNKKNPYMSELVQPFKRQSQQTNAFQMYAVVLFVLFRKLLFPFRTQYLICPDRNVYIPLESKTGQYLWEITVHHVQGHDSICVCQSAKLCQPIQSPLWGKDESQPHALPLSLRKGNSSPSSAVIS